MSILPRILGLTVLAALAVGSGALAEERAKINQPRVNIRGQAVLTSEVVTQLQKDEEVTILEEITPANPKPGEPAKWSKIRMPSNTPVWVFGPYLKDKTNASRRLNLRAGPGENYSVVGRLEKGDGIKEIRTVGEWVEIETPATAYAFVDAALLTKGSEAAPATLIAEKQSVREETVKVEAKDLAAKNPSIPAAAPAKAATSPTPITPGVPTQAPLTKTVVVETPPPLLVPPPAVAKTPASQPVAVPPAPQAAAVTPSVVPMTPLTKATPVVRKDSGPKARRLVRREGSIRSTRFNIQAPTYFELVSNENGKVINYIHADKSGVNVKEFRGKSVIVTGEEGIDPRYTGIPVLELETIETAP